MTLNLEHTALAVVDLSEHMDRLRCEAIALQESFDTGKRGYFSPSEDNCSRHSKQLLSGSEMMDVLQATIAISKPLDS